MIKPPKLQYGSKIAIVSPSWGGPYEFPWRYKAGKKQLNDAFGFELIDMPNTKKNPDFLSKNPKARAEDIMMALESNEIDGIISSIGGEDSIKVLPFIEEEAIKKNPKVFIGYSDSTCIHFAFYKSGIISFYGPSIMAGFAENRVVDQYLLTNFERVLMNPNIIGKIEPNLNGYAINNPSWDVKSNQFIKCKKYESKNGFKLLNGSKTVQGELIGGCLDTLESLKGTDFWISDWDNKILFIETSEDTPSIAFFRRWLVNYGVQGVFDKISGLLFGRHLGEHNEQIKYEQVLIDVVVKDFNCKNLVIMSNMDFGHTRPIFTIPYGVLAEISAERKTFKIMENAVC